MAGAYNTLINPNFPVTDISKQRAHVSGREYRTRNFQQGFYFPEGAIVYLTQTGNQVYCTPCPANETYPNSLPKGEEWKYLRENEVFSTDSGYFGVSVAETNFDNFEKIFDVHCKEKSNVRMQNFSNETLEIGDLFYADVPNKEEVDAMLDRHKLFYPVFVPRRLKPATRRVETTLRDTLQTAKAINDSRPVPHKYLTKTKHARIMLDLFSIVGIVMNHYENYPGEQERVKQLLTKIRQNTFDVAYIMKTVYQEMKLFHTENESGQLILRKIQNIIHNAHIQPLGRVLSVEYHSQGDGTVLCRPGEYFFAHIY